MLLPTLGKMRSEASYIFRLRFGILRILALLARLYAPAALKADQSADFIHLTDGANVTITAYIGTNTAVMIPDTIIGLPVTSIGNKAFFPHGVTNIGTNAFQTCLTLTSVTIPKSVIDLGENAFNVCTDLTNVAIGNRVTNIGSAAFAECTALSSVIVPNSVTSIGLGCSILGPAWATLRSRTASCVLGTRHSTTAPAWRPSRWMRSIPFIAVRLGFYSTKAKPRLSNIRVARKEAII
jgi:hypothetical protein